MFFTGCKQSAGRQADQIHSVGVGTGFIEIVDSPDQASVDIAPCAEVLHVQVAYRQDMRNFVEVGTSLGPHLQPAVEGRAKKWKEGGRHPLVLQAQVRLDDAN